MMQAESFAEVARLLTLWGELEHSRQRKAGAGCRDYDRGTEFGLRLAQTYVADVLGIETRLYATEVHLRQCADCRALPDKAVLG